MYLIEQLMTFFKKPEEETKDSAPEGICPLCWGYQQYDGKIRTLIKDKQIDINNHLKAQTFFEEVVKTHIEGIHLKEAEISNCPHCTDLEENNGST